MPGIAVRQIGPSGSGGSGMVSTGVEAWLPEPMPPVPRNIEYRLQVRPGSLTITLLVPVARSLAARLLVPGAAGFPWTARLIPKGDEERGNVLAVSIEGVLARRSRAALLSTRSECGAGAGGGEPGRRELELDVVGHGLGAADLAPRRGVGHGDSVDGVPPNVVVAAKKCARAKQPPQCAVVERRDRFREGGRQNAYNLVWSRAERRALSGSRFAGRALRLRSHRASRREGCVAGALNSA
jgi:hypothetical protein